MSELARKLTSPVNRLLAVLGIDSRAYWALVKAYLLMDFRNQQFAGATASGKGAVITPLFWVLGQNLMIGLFLGGFLFARVDAYFYGLAALAASMIVMATSMIVEFNEVVLDPEDLNVIGHQPVPPRVYSAARVSNLMVYVLTVTFTLNLFPAIIGVGLLDTSWWWLPAYTLAALIGNLSITGLIILLYLLLLGGRPGDGAREYLAWTQVAMVALTFYGGQMMLRDPNQKIQMLAYQLPEWVVYLPPAWLAMFVESTGPAAATVLWWIPAMGVLLTVVIWTAVIWRLSAAYAR